MSEVRTLLPARQGPPQTVNDLFRREDATIRRLNAVANNHLSGERAAHLALSAIRKTPMLGQCTPVSFMGALMASTALGLEVNTLKEQAYLIPYKHRQPRRDQRNRIVEDENGSWIWDEWYECQLQIGYRGFITLFSRSALVRSVTAETVYDVDHFVQRKGSEALLEYEKCLDKPRFRPGDENRDPYLFSPGLRAAFCFTELRDGQSFTVLTLQDLETARGRSQAWTNARREIDIAAKVLADAEQQKLTGKKLDDATKRVERSWKTYRESPWVLWEESMCAKTAIRRHIKQSDTGEDTTAQQITLAADLDALSDAGLIDMAALEDEERAVEILKNGSPDLRKSDPPSDDGGDGEQANQPKDQPPAQEQTGAGSGNAEQKAGGDGPRPSTAAPAEKGAAATSTDRSAGPSNTGKPAVVSRGKARDMGGLF